MVCGLTSHVLNEYVIRYVKRKPVHTNRFIRPTL